MNDCYPEKKESNLKGLKSTSISYEWKDYFRRLRHGRRKSCMIDASVHLEEVSNHNQDSGRDNRK